MLPTTEFPETIKFYDFEGGINFRDIGGYRTEDGRTVRYGQFFRSGMMSGLTESDVGELNALTIRSICDFRSRNEREEHPSHWIAGKDIDQSLRHDTDGLGDVTKFYESVRKAPEMAREVMLGAYRTMPYTLAESYRAMFAFMLAGRVPMIFHCAGGKDRTGIAAGLVLTALGVPRDTILQDYRATDRLYDRLFEVMRAQAEGSFDLDKDREIWRPLLVCEPAYLEATFAEMELRDGSVEGFLNDHVGVDGSALEKLRQLYTH